MSRKSIILFQIVLITFLLTLIGFPLINAQDWSPPYQLTFDNFAVQDQIISADGSKVAFTDQDEQNLSVYVLWVINSDGTGLTQLTSTHAHDPEISGDGSKIAFQSHSDENWDIMVVNSDGTGLIQLTDDTTRVDNPSISANGSTISFESSKTSDFMEVWIVTYGEEPTPTSPPPTSPPSPTLQPTPTESPTPTPSNPTPTPELSPESEFSLPIEYIAGGVVALIFALIGVFFLTRK